MKLKYYLRGAGIGFIVSAILFAVFLTALDWGPRQGHVSTQEASADEAMMGDTVKEAEEKKKAENESEETTKTSEVDVNKETAKTEDAPKVEEKKEDKPEVNVPTLTKTDDEVENTKEPKVTGNVKFSIKDGEASNAIAKNLETLGLVDDAKAFDQFLSENGYDHRLRTGDFEISTGMSYKDLAELLCKKQ